MPKKWEPSPEDAISLAAFRWFANTIENFAIELYATDRDSFEDVAGVLRTTLKELQRTKQSFAISDESCPDGWVLCQGVCAPACEMLAEAQVATPERKAAGKRGKRKR